MDLYTNASSLHVGAHVTKTYVGVEVHVQFDAFITSAINGDQLSASCFTLHTYFETINSTDIT